MGRHVTSSPDADGRPGKNWRVRYELALPGGFTGVVILLHTDRDPPRRCAGRFIKGPIKGTWKYAYSEQGGATELTYSMDYELPGCSASRVGCWRTSTRRASGRPWTPSSATWRKSVGGLPRK